MNMANKTLLAFLSLLLSIGHINSVFAATCINSASYFYINGVSLFADTHRFIAADSIKRLLIARGVITTEVVTPLRNPSEGIFIDVFVELVNQKLAEKSAANFAQAVQKSAMTFTGNPAQSMSVADQVLLNAKMAAFFDRTKNLPATSSVTAGMTSTVTAALSGGNKVIVIAHSQGNMFANAVLNSLTVTQPANIVAGLKVVSIATPSALAQDRRYKTANQDSIITKAAADLAVALIAPLPLVANIDVPGALAYDLTGHGLLEVYFNPALTSIDLIVAMVSNAATSAINPTCPQPVVAALCPNTFTQTQLSQVVPGLTVSQVDAVFGCAGRNAGVSNWFMWYNNLSLIAPTMNTATVLFASGVYQTAPGSKSISGPVLP